MRGISSETPAKWKSAVRVALQNWCSFELFSANWLAVVEMCYTICKPTELTKCSLMGKQIAEGNFLLHIAVIVLWVLKMERLQCIVVA